MNEFKESLKATPEITPEKRLKSRLTNMLVGQIEIIKNNPTLNPQDKYVQSTIIFNTIRFLQDYNKNIKILNENLYNHRFDKEK